MERGTTEEPGTHELKCWPPYFQHIADGLKNFEIRRQDRHFQVGDNIRLLEWDPNTKEYTGRFRSLEITYIFAGGSFGLMPGYCCIGFYDETDDLIAKHGKTYE